RSSMRMGIFTKRIPYGLLTNRLKNSSGSRNLSIVTCLDARQLRNQLMVHEGTRTGACGHCQRYAPEFRRIVAGCKNAWYVSLLEFVYVKVPTRHELATQLLGYGA